MFRSRTSLLFFFFLRKHLYWHLAIILDRQKNKGERVGSKESVWTPWLQLILKGREAERMGGFDHPCANHSWNCLRHGNLLPLSVTLGY